MPAPCEMISSGDRSNRAGLERSKRRGSQSSYSVFLAYPCPRNQLNRPQRDRTPHPRTESRPRAVSRCASELWLAGIGLRHSIVLHNQTHGDLSSTAAPTPSGRLSAGTSAYALLTLLTLSPLCSLSIVCLPTRPANNFSLSPTLPLPLRPTPCETLSLL